MDILTLWHHHKHIQTHQHTSTPTYKHSTNRNGFVMMTFLFGWRSISSPWQSSTASIAFIYYSSFHTFPFSKYPVTFRWGWSLKNLIITMAEISLICSLFPVRYCMITRRALSHPFQSTLLWSILCVSMWSHYQISVGWMTELYNTRMWWQIGMVIIEYNSISSVLDDHRSTRRFVVVGSGHGCPEKSFARSKNHVLEKPWKTSLSLRWKLWSKTANNRFLDASFDRYLTIILRFR